MWLAFTLFLFTPLLPADSMLDLWDPLPISGKVCTGSSRKQAGSHLSL